MKISIIIFALILINTHNSISQPKSTGKIYLESGEVLEIIQFFYINHRPYSWSHSSERLGYFNIDFDNYTRKLYLRNVKSIEILEIQDSSMSKLKLTTKSGYELTSTSGINYINVRIINRSNNQITTENIWYYDIRKIVFY